MLEAQPLLHTRALDLARVRVRVRGRVRVRVGVGVGVRVRVGLGVGLGGPLQMSGDVETGARFERRSLTVSSKVSKTLTIFGWSSIFCTAISWRSSAIDCAAIPWGGR